MFIIMEEDQDVTNPSPSAKEYLLTEALREQAPVIFETIPTDALD